MLTKPRRNPKAPTPAPPAAPAPPATPGRPRSQHAKRAVIAAVRALVAARGYPGATIEAIAARSGVAKTTIYRWWPNRPALVVEVLVEMAMEVAPPPPPAGQDPVQALRTEMRLVAQALDQLAGQLVISLLGEAQHDADTHRALMQQLFMPRRRATAKVVQQAQRTGALRKDVPPLVAVDLMFGPLFYRRSVLHEPVAGRFVKQVTEQVLAGLSVLRARRT